MAKISAALVKQLRDKTGAGMGDCKKALVETDGDVEAAVDVPGFPRSAMDGYAIRGEEGSKMISVNGAAAHKAQPGHRVIICAYANYSSSELINYKPRLIYMDEGNEVKGTSNAIPVQVA